MLRTLGVAAVAACALAGTAAAAPCVTTNSDFVVDGITCTLSGVWTFNTVTVKNGGVITVSPFTSGDKTLTGNLELRAKTITVDATSKIVAKGAGYQTQICGNGNGPNAAAGGRGGCALLDSGGGGAHFGRGGRGTTDITPPQQFPRDFEEDCGNSVVYNGSGVPSCSNTTGCRNKDGLPTVAGTEYYHSIYQAEFGASGGDKGCRDGDGTTVNVSGSGGGRIVLAAVSTSMNMNTVTINGTLDATGKRGCGDGNDSAGGGAGGTILVAGDIVNIGATAVVTAAGGRGGDTLGGMANGECPAPAQQTGTCDDCGGGGGGGIVSIQSVTSNISDEAVFSVNGALGGVCPICTGEAGGGVGELQISNGYTGEFCDGFDNDFDGLIDEGLGTLNCGSSTLMACISGVPQTCPPQVPSCEGVVTDSRTRFAVIVDTSGSMLSTLAGVPTFGDGSTGHAGVDFDGNGVTDDSRLYKAKQALNTVISAYPEIDFALARYHQDELANRNCQMAHNFECNQICCSYDDPRNNTGPSPAPACTVNGGAAGTLTVKDDSPGDECINYAGNCGPPRRGADVLVGFGADINNYLMWLDGKETNFNAVQTTGAFCNFAAGGDCELRGTGPTPLANSLQAVEDYLTPIKACDKASIGGCRKYNVILLTDGAESCQGDPVAAAAALRAKGINTYVVGFSTLATEAAQLNAVAAAGGTGTAFLVGSEDALANALASIVSGSIVFETCNNLDDDCDGKIDEDFPGKGNACDNGQLGACHTTGTLVCKADGSGLQCNAATGPAPGTEICNGLDDDCDGKIDEGVAGCACVPQGEQCDGLDNDCDGKVDEGLTRACGTGTCQGIETCTMGGFSGCTAKTPTTEICNGVDDNCDGVIDGINASCSNINTPGGPATDNPGGNPTSACSAEGALCACHPGSKTCPAGGAGTFGACTGEVVPTVEICNGIDDDCDGKIDEGTGGADCSTNCGVGTTVCVNGAITCNSMPGTTDDTCDGNDDDCDGKIDENYVPVPCDDGGTVCMGMTKCVGGTVQCSGEPITQETCNCLDDDCDGKTDEGSLCGNGATCTNCQCAFQCAAGEFPCPLGKTCNAQNFCVADPCFNVTCPNGQACTVNGNDHSCVPVCDTVTCPVGLTCVGGACKPNNCTTFPEMCTAGQQCVNGTCVTNLCAGVTCPTDEYCELGQCYASCAGVTCPTGQRCRLGTCQADPCGKECPSGQVCDTGTATCVPNPCGVVQCPQGQYCDPENGGQCTDDPCVGTTCPHAGEICQGGTCYDPSQFLPDAGVETRVTAAGGGGCSTGGGNAGWLALGLLALLRRRRS